MININDNAEEIIIDEVETKYTVSRLIITGSIGSTFDLYETLREKKLKSIPIPGARRKILKNTLSKVLTDTGKVVSNTLVYLLFVSFISTTH